MLIWFFFIAVGLSCVLLHFETKATRDLYLDIYQNKMLITKEYTRRVTSDVYVAVTNNIYYLEQTLDNPDGHKLTMERIVQSGTRVRSCGIGFIEDYYYAQKQQHRFYPFAWRNVAKPDVISSEDMGDANLNYLESDRFRSIFDSDSAQWSQPFYDSDDKNTALAAYMVPIHDQDGRTIAVLSADISLDWLTGKINEIDSTINDNAAIVSSTFNLKSNSYIINYDGKFITHFEEERIIKDNFFSQLQSCDGSDVDGLVSKMKAGVENVNRSHERFIVDGEECFVFYTPIKYTKWLFVTVVPCHAIDVMSYLNGFTVILIVILAMLLVIPVGYYYMKSGIAPLRQLTHTADYMAKGRFDAPMPELTHNDEISQLCDSLEKMQFALFKYTDDKKRSADKKE